MAKKKSEAAEPERRTPEPVPEPDLGSLLMAKAAAEERENCARLAEKHGYWDLASLMRERRW